MPCHCSVSIAAACGKALAPARLDSRGRASSAPTLMRVPPGGSDVSGRLSIAAVAVALVSLVFFQPGQALALDCPKAHEVEMIVTPVHGEISRNDTIGVAEIQHLAGPEIAARHYPLLGMALAKVVYGMETNTDVSESDDGSFCATVKKVDVKVGFARRVLFVAREASADACVDREVLAHERRHARVDDEALDAFVPKLSKRLRAAMLSMRPTPAASAGAARTNVATAATAQMEKFMQQFDAHREAMHRALDSPQELDQLRAACGGRAQILAGPKPLVHF